MAKVRTDSWAAGLSEEQSWELYSKHRMGQAAIAAAEAAALGGKCTKDEALIQAFKALATDVALTTGDAKSASAFVNSAMAIKDRLQKEQELALNRLQKEQELALKSAAQSTKDEQLKLAREKFEAAEKRLNAVQGAVDAPQLTDAERVAKIKSIFGMK